MSNYEIYMVTRMSLHWNNLEIQKQQKVMLWRKMSNGSDTASGRPCFLKQRSLLWPDAGKVLNSLKLCKKN